MNPAQPGSGLGAERRFALLAEMGRELSSSLDSRVMLERLADLMVAELADYCLVDVFDEDGNIQRAAVAHRKLEGRELVLELQRRYPPNLGASTGAGLVLRTGEPVLTPEVTEEQIRAAAQDEEHLRLLLRLGPRSSILVPLVAHGRVLGVLVLAITNGERRYDAGDLALAEELAARAAMAVENAQLFQQVQQTARRLEDSVAALRETNQTLSALIQACPLAVMVLRPEDATVQLWNPAAERIFGWTEEEILGRPMPAVPEDRREEFQGILQSVVRGEPMQGVETRRLKKDGTVIDVGLWVAALPAPDGVRVLGIVNDVTERQRLVAERGQLAEELRLRVEELAAADRRKDEFLAMLAHELRNPLAAISNAGHVLDRRSSGDPRSHELLAVIGRQIRHLSRLVDDLLDVSRFSRGKIELRREPIELRRALEGAVETARPLAEQRRHELAVTLPDEPLWLEADLTRIEQIFANLLHNAAKFTEPGGHVSLGAERRGSEVVVTVRDDGAGISPTLLPHVFDLFVQEERSLARSQGGLGIGLTLVHNLVERHGGTIEAASDGPGRGSAFTVRLPVIEGPTVEATDGVEADLVPARESSGEKPARVLIVEDNLDAAEALSELLRMWGHDVEVTHDGVSALRAARQGEPDVVLLDIGLPGMDGYEVARELRAIPGLAAARLIALTGYGQESDRRRSSLAGVDHHLVKPVDLERLRALLIGS